MFGNKQCKERSALQKDTITSEPPPKDSVLNKVEFDGVCPTDNDKILDSSDKTPHECAIGRKKIGQKRQFPTHKRAQTVEKQYKYSVSRNKPTEKKCSY